MTTTPPGAAHVQFSLSFGLDTFGDVSHDEDDCPLSHAQTIRDVVEQGVLADQVGVDFFGIGEHHTEDFPMPAGDVVLSAIAARTDPTSSSGTPSPSGRSTTSAAAPRWTACGANSWPSLRKPLTQKKRSPGATERLS